MRQTKKETLAKKIECFSNLKYPNFLDKVEEIYNFRKENSLNIKKTIELKQFSIADLENFWKFYSVISSSCYYEKWEKLKEITEDICKSYITLLIQFNKPFDKYLKIFDKESAFFKKMTALNIIRWYRGSIDKFRFEFKNISNLLYEAIELDPKIYDQCCNIAFEYLDIVLPKHDFFEKHDDELSNIQRINFLYKYWESKFIDLLRIHEDFDNWLNICVSTDNRSYSKDWFDHIIEEIFSWRKISVEVRKSIEKKFTERFSEIYKLFDLKEKYQKQEIEEFNELLNKYIKEYKWWDESILESYNYIDEVWYFIYDEISELEKKYYWDWSHIIEIWNYELNDIDKYIKNESQLEYSTFWQWKKTILCYRNYWNKITEKVINKAFNQLKKYSKVTFFKWKEYEVTKDMEYEIHELPGDLGILFHIKVIIELLRSSFYDNSFFNNKELKHIDISKKIIDLVRDLNKELSSSHRLDESFDNTEENKKIDVVSNESENPNWEPNEDKKAISELDKRVDEYKRTIDEYYSKINELEKENRLYKALLIENWLSNEDWKKEEDIIERRKLYRITVIWWSPESIKWFNNLQKNKDFMDKLENIYHLEFKQLELVWDYKKQQDKKFADKIENDLIFWNTDFVIALQTDHETPLINLIKKFRDDVEYKHRINYFWQADENWNISKDNQHFSYTKFDKYLEVALNKYETSENNNLIALS